jgi:hypothetical protein
MLLEMAKIMGKILNVLSFVGATLGGVLVVGGFFVSCYFLPHKMAEIGVLVFVAVVSSPLWGPVVLLVFALLYDVIRVIWPRRCPKCKRKDFILEYDENATFSDWHGPTFPPPREVCSKCGTLIN